MKLIFAILIAVAFVCQLVALDEKEKPQPHPQCPTGPSEDPVHPVHLPYPGDCTKFYKCLRGLAYPLDCNAAGLHWSQNNISCLWAGQENPPCPY